MRRLLLLVSLVFAASCGDSLLGPVTTLDGNWNGIQSGYSMSMALTQTGTTVTGNATLAGVAGALAGTVTGTFVSPNVNLTITIDGANEPVTYTGTLSNSVAKIFARLNGSGFNNQELDIAKH